MATDRLPRGISGRVWVLHSLLGRSECSTQTLPEIDRKSTRLNSTHTVIPYAVFCLKKKTYLQMIQKLSPERDRIWGSQLTRHRSRQEHAQDLGPAWLTRTAELRLRAIGRALCQLYL